MADEPPDESNDMFADEAGMFWGSSSLPSPQSTAAPTTPQAPTIIAALSHSQTRLREAILPPQAGATIHTPFIRGPPVVKHDPEPPHPNGNAHTHLLPPARSPSPISSPHSEDSNHELPTNEEFFGQLAGHEENGSEEAIKAEDRHEITSKFLDAFFVVPAHNPSQHELDYDMFMFLYEGLVPKRCRQRPQEIGKTRIKKLEAVLIQTGAMKHEDVNGLLASPAGLNTVQESSKVKLAKRTWSHQHNKRLVLQGIQGPYLNPPANVKAMEELATLLHRPAIALNNDVFERLWAKFHTDTLEPAKKRRKTEQHNVVYDLVRVETANHCRLEYQFELPGVNVPPVVAINKRQRTWKISGSKPAPVHTAVVSQQRWTGTFALSGEVPASVDITIEPTIHLADGLFILSFTEFGDETDDGSKAMVL